MNLDWYDDEHIENANGLNKLQIEQLKNVSSHSTLYERYSVNSSELVGVSSFYEQSMTEFEPQVCHNDLRLDQEQLVDNSELSQEIQFERLIDQKLAGLINTQPSFSIDLKLADQLQVKYSENVQVQTQVPNSPEGNLLNDQCEMSEYQTENQEDDSKALKRVKEKRGKKTVLRLILQSILKFFDNSRSKEELLKTVKQPTLYDWKQKVILGLIFGYNFRTSLDFQIGDLRKFVNLQKNTLGKSQFDEYCRQAKFQTVELCDRIKEILDM